MQYFTTQDCVLHVAEDEQLPRREDFGALPFTRERKENKRTWLVGDTVLGNDDDADSNGGGSGDHRAHGDICSSKDVINHISGGENERERRAELRFYQSPWEHGNFTQHPTPDLLKACYDFFSCNTSSSNGADAQPQWWTDAI